MENNNNNSDNGAISMSNVNKIVDDNALIDGIKEQLQEFENDICEQHKTNKELDIGRDEMQKEIHAKLAALEERFIDELQQMVMIQKSRNNMCKTMKTIKEHKLFDEDAWNSVNKYILKEDLNQNKIYNKTMKGFCKILRKECKIKNAKAKEWFQLISTESGIYKYICNENLDFEWSNYNIVLLSECNNMELVYVLQKIVSDINSESSAEEKKVTDLEDDCNTIIGFVRFREISGSDFKDMGKQMLIQQITNATKKPLKHAQNAISIVWKEIDELEKTKFESLFLFYRSLSVSEIKECNLDQIEWLLEKVILPDEKQSYKEQIVDCIREGKIDGKKLLELEKSGFMAEVIEYFDDQKSKGFAGKIFRKLKQMDFSKVPSQKDLFDRDKMKKHLMHNNELPELAKHKEVIIKYFEKNKIDGKALNAKKKVKFANDVSVHISDTGDLDKEAAKKLNGTLNKLYRLVAKIHKENDASIEKTDRATIVDLLNIIIGKDCEE